MTKFQTPETDVAEAGAARAKSNGASGTKHTPDPDAIALPSALVDITPQRNNFV